MNHQKHLSAADLEAMPSRTRATFFNLLSGIQPAVIVATADAEGRANAAVFNSLTHIGSNPPLLALFFRPATVERHTWDNIQHSKVYTINFLPAAHAAAVHQSSAKYASDQSEFDACGWTTEYLTDFHAPVIQEAGVSLGLRLEEVLPVQSNGTFMVIGRVEWIRFPENLMQNDGWFDWAVLDPLLVGGLDDYFGAVPLQRFAYAQAGQEPQVLTRTTP